MNSTPPDSSVPPEGSVSEDEPAAGQLPEFLQEGAIEEADTAAASATELPLEHTDGAAASPAEPPSEVAAMAEAGLADEAPTDLPLEERAMGEVSRGHLKGLIEALVFVAEKPVPLADIGKIAGKPDRKLLRELVEELRAEYHDRGIHLEEVAGGLVFRTSAIFAPFVRDVAATRPVKMTRAQIETLSIIAYRQPLTRPEVDEIRGVDSGAVMRMLLERDLIKIMGKKDEPGRPLLYSTTPTFLHFFGLKSLKDLPSLREFTELSDDSRRTFEQEMAEIEVAGPSPSAPVPASPDRSLAEDPVPPQGGEPDGYSSEGSG